jgi:hypothetical protein
MILKFNQFYLLLLLINFELNAQITLSQNTSDDILIGNSLSCNRKDNIYYRAFNLNNYNYSSFQVNSVDFGIEAISNMSDGFAVEAVIFGTNSFPLGTLTEIEEVSVPLESSDSETIKSVPISANVDASVYPILVVAIRVPEYNSTGFFIGSNDSGESAPSYLSSTFASCYLTNPTNASTLTTKQNHYVLKVSGSAEVLSTNQFYLNKLNVYPNPTSNSIQITGLTKTEKYKIYNVQGKEMSYGVVSSTNKIDIQNLTNGIYFLKFDGGNTLKFIKSN